MTGGGANANPKQHELRPHGHHDVRHTESTLADKRPGGALGLAEPTHQSNSWPDPIQPLPAHEPYQPVEGDFAREDAERLKAMGKDVHVLTEAQALTRAALEKDRRVLERATPGSDLTSMATSDIDSTPSAGGV